MIKQLCLLLTFLTFNSVFAQTVCTRQVTAFDYSTTTGYSITGTAELKDSLGVLYLTFSSDFFTSPGPDLYVYLTETGAAPTAPGNDDYEVAILTSNSGAQSYTIPSTVSLNDYDYVTIHCKQFNHLWNSGQLSPQSCFTYPTYSNITVEECFSYTSPSGQMWMSTGVYTDTLVGMNSGGGDSIITIDLTVNTTDVSVMETATSVELMAEASNSTFQWINCSTNSMISGETEASFIPTESGTYAVVVTSQNSCVDTSSCFSVLIEEECISYTSPSGQMWMNSGIYADTLFGMNANGGDSVIKIDLTVNTVDVGVTESQTTNTLTADASNSTFQWINCADNMPISGETNATFTPTEVGDYAVVVTSSDNCVDTSACFSIHTVGINENETTTYNVYPNPVVDYLTIDGEGLDVETIRVFNVLNQSIQFEVMHKATNQATLGINGPKGIYTIYFANTYGEAKTVKVIKN